MECLTVLLEHEAMQTYLSENEGIIMAGAELFAEFPQVVKDYINEHLDQFIDENVETTYQNMVTFAESASFQFLNEICDMVIEQEEAAAAPAA